MLASERALTVEGGYQETNTVLLLDTHTPTQIHTKGFVKTEEADAGHVIYFAPVPLPPR